MSLSRSDAFVFFGATDDLAHKEIFPALLGLIRDEDLELPCVMLGPCSHTDRDATTPPQTPVGVSFESDNLKSPELLARHDLVGGFAGAVTIPRRVRK